MTWSTYLLQCLHGTETATTYVLTYYARDVQHAYALARSDGYTPLGLAAPCAQLSRIL
jgi:hypothetical protein